MDIDLNLIPLTPGVYLFKTADGKIIYVGKAKCLRRRVASYFPGGKGDTLSIKTRAMLRQAADLSTLSTTTEKEALLLEAELIKKHRPRYNITLRDDKQYFLFRLDKNHPFPRLAVVRPRPVRESAKEGPNGDAVPAPDRPVRAERNVAMFGPYTSGLAARETWRLLHQIFPLRRCTDRVFRNRVRPCLYYHMKQCLGPCSLPVDKAQYAAMVEQVEMLLGGRARELTDALNAKMLAAAEKLEFEDAARLRDQIKAVEKTVEQQAVVFQSADDADALGLAETNNGLGLAVIFVRSGKVLDGRTFFWPGLTLAEGGETITGFLGQFYTEGSRIPPRILLPWKLPQAAEDAAADPAELWEEALSDLRGAPARLFTPHTPRERGLIRMAEANARQSANAAAQQPLAEILAAALHLPAPPARIEAVDISHTGGEETRAGLVVFVDGAPRRDEFRAYIIGGDQEGAPRPPLDLPAPGAKPLDPDGVHLANSSATNSASLPSPDRMGLGRGGVWGGETIRGNTPGGFPSPESTSPLYPNLTPGDDYAALAAFTRRRLESGPPWPDLLLIDGGLGQLGVVARVLQEAGQDDAFPIAAIAKARNEAGRPDRRAGNVADRIFIPGRKNPLPLREGSPELLFLQRIRDAVHDHALGRHRKARTKSALSEALLSVPGVGPKTAALLWAHFDSLAEMAAAGEEMLGAIPGIGRMKAEKLKAELVRFAKADKLL